jgi:hypothetical protein
MDMYTASRSRTGANAATADAARMRVQKQRAERTATESDRRGGARTERVKSRDKDRYDRGEAAYVVRMQMRKAPDQQTYTPHPRAERNHQAESRRSSRA